MDEPFENDPGYVDHTAAALCQRLLCAETVETRELVDTQLYSDVEERLAAVGFRITAVDGKLYAQGHALNEGAAGYSEPQLAALALLSVDLLAAPAPGDGGHVKVSDFHARFSKGQGWSKDWLRRAVLGPLERDGYLRVVAPGQRRSDEYIAAGPRLHSLDRGRLTRALTRLIDAQMTDAA